MTQIRTLVLSVVFAIFITPTAGLAQDAGIAPPAADETLIYLFREGRFAGSLNKMWIAVNDKTVARVQNEAYAVVRAQAGRITLNLATAGIVAGAIAIDDRPGETVYLNWRLGDIHIAELDAEAAHALLQDYKRTPPIEELRPNNEQVEANFALDVLGLELTHPTEDVVEPDEDHAVIAIFRGKKKELVKVAVWGEDRYIAMLEANQGVQIKVPAGENIIFTGLTPSAVLEANVEAGKHYYAQLDIGLVKLKVEPVRSKDAKKLQKMLENVEYVAVDQERVTDRVRERETLVTDFLKEAIERDRAAGNAYQAMGSEHAF